VPFEQLMESLMQSVAALHDKSETLSRICDALERGQPEMAKGIVAAEYPFSPPERSSRKYSELDRIRVFVRDRFALSGYPSTAIEPARERGERLLSAPPKLEDG